MRDKVEQMEAEAQVSKQLAAATPEGSSSSMEDQFKALESAGDIDDEIAAMKKNILPQSPVDDELEAMKKMLEDEK